MAEQADAEADWRTEIKNFHVDYHQDKLIKQRVLNLMNGLFQLIIN